MSVPLLRSCVHRLTFRCLAICLFVLGAMQAHAQSGQVSGAVKDPSQSLVVQAQVTLDNATIHLTTATDGSGAYGFASVPAGTYHLSAQKSGFTPVSVSVTVTAQGTVTRDLIFTGIDSNSSVTVNGAITGTPQTGYYVDHVQPGMLGTAPIVNQPTMITILPADQVMNTQAKSLRDSIKYLPLVSFNEQQGPEILRPSTRGIQGSIVENTRMDGMAMAITSANAMEQYQTMLVENGLAASFYGPQNPSGIFDFTLKRPTDEHTTNLYLEQDSDTIGTAYLDTGGRLGASKRFGYRSNLLYGDGGAFVDDARMRRRLAEFAFDVRTSPKTSIDAHYSAYDIVQRGYPGWFTYGPNKADTVDHPAHTLLLPNAPDPTRVGYGQPFAGVNLTTQSTSARIHYELTPNWHMMAGGLGQRLDRFIDTPVNNLTDSAGDYSTSLATGFAPRFGTESDLGYITGSIHKWGLQQDVVIGSQGYKFTQYGYTSPSAASVLLGTANINNPRVFAPPAVLPSNRNYYQASIVHQQGFSIGDLITFPKKFMVRLAGSQDWIGVDNNTATARTSGSNKNGISPSASVMYKPEEAMTIYATFASSLQQGDVAPGNAVNANQALAPYRSNEWELGMKTETQAINLTAALFRIQRPFANANAQNVFLITGQQVNFGAEVSAQGTLFHRLLIDGGFAALNARLNDTGIAATNGQRFVGTPSYKSGLYSEFIVPGVANLTLTGDWQFVGRRPQDDENVNYTRGYNTFDFGFRYAHQVLSKMTTLRFTTDNLGNIRYYSTIGPGDITGTNASSNTAHIGPPRIISTSLQIAF